MSDKIRPVRKSDRVKTLTSVSKPSETYPRTKKETETHLMPVESIGLLFSCVWLFVLGVIFFVLEPSVTPQLFTAIITILLVVVLPLALILIIVSVAKMLQSMHENASRLQVSFDAMRLAFLKLQPEAKSSSNVGAEKISERPLPIPQNEVDQIADHPDTLIIPHFRSIHTEKKLDDNAQASLALGTRMDELPHPNPLTMEEIICAVNFPETEADKKGFQILRRALKDHKIAKLIKASQDVLTLMSQDGIYMDDLVPDRAKPDVWRKFVNGDRGREIAALGGIRDRSSLALTSNRMKSDPVFRDTVFHFMRQFDKFCSDILPHATDIEITRFANTRSARAFMVIGRVTGTFR